jgi:hypothetical protein
MKNKLNICLFCRHALRPSNLPTKRHYSSLRQISKKPFILNRLVVDLDARDSKYVKPVEELNEQNSLYNFLQGRSKPKHRPVRIPKPLRPEVFDLGPFQTRAVTTMDLFTYAMKGDYYWSRSSGKPSLLRDIFDRLRIETRDTADNKFEQLLVHYTTKEETNLNKAGFQPSNRENEEAIKKQITRYSSFRSLRRLISMLSRTKVGCKFLARNGGSVVEGIFSCRQRARSQGAEKRDARSHADDILKVLNNLRLNMESKGIEIGPDLCNIGLYFAASILQIQSMETYLRLMVANNYQANRYTRPAMFGFFSIKKLRDGQRRDVLLLRLMHNTGMALKQTTMTLLTGWQTSGVPQPGEQRQPSFRSLVLNAETEKAALNLFTTYILTLGCLQEHEAVWYEATKAMLPTSIRSLMAPRPRACLFAIALLIANQPAKAKLLMESAFEEPSSTEYGPVLLPALLQYYRSQELHIGERLKNEIANLDLVGRSGEEVFRLLEKLLSFEKKVWREGDEGVKWGVEWVGDEGGNGRLEISEWVREKGAAVERRSKPVLLKAVGSASEFQDI